MDLNTLANILTSICVIVLAIVGYLRSRTTVRKLDHVTDVVNSRFTDLEKYIIALKKQIVSAGQTPVDDQSKGI